MATRSFNQQVYHLVQRIPLGMVTTYGSIAAALGDPRKAREVGWALYAKPEGVAAPAHRVVNREGRLSGGWAFGGPQVQQAMLEAEGVHFLEDGSIDLARHLWKPERPLPPAERLDRTLLGIDTAISGDAPFDSNSDAEPGHHGEGTNDCYDPFRIAAPCRRTGGAWRGREPKLPSGQGS